MRLHNNHEVWWIEFKNCFRCGSSCYDCVRRAHGFQGALGKTVCYSRNWHCERNWNGHYDACSQVRHEREWCYGFLTRSKNWRIEVWFSAGEQFGRWKAVPLFEEKITQPPFKSNQTYTKIQAGLSLFSTALVKDLVVFPTPFRLAVRRACGLDRASGVRPKIHEQTRGEKQTADIRVHHDNPRTHCKILERIFLCFEHRRDVESRYTSL